MYFTVELGEYSNANSTQVFVKNTLLSNVDARLPTQFQKILESELRFKIVLYLWMFECLLVFVSIREYQIALLVEFYNKPLYCHAVRSCWMFSRTGLSVSSMQRS